MFINIQKTSLFFILYSLFFIHSSLSQQQYLSLNRQNNLWIHKHLNHTGNFSHTAFKPLLESFVGYDSLTVMEKERKKPKEYKRWTGRKLKKENLITVDTGKFQMTIDPLFYFEYGKDLADTSVRTSSTQFYRNTRGILLKANIGDKLSVMSSLYENQAFFPAYIHNYIKQSLVAPGEGRVKIFKQHGYDFAIASGYISFTPIKRLNFVFGHDKNFIGDGYRSLLLSDNSFNYPFFKITSLWWKGRIQYSTNYASLQSLSRIPAGSTPEALFENKAATFHYLSIILHRRLQIGFFEGIIWQRRDSAGSLPFNYNFINPVLGVNTAILGFGKSNNSVMGINLKTKLTNSISLYGQGMYDKPGRFGFQAGVDYFDCFTIKNLNIQAEYNMVTPWSYTSTFTLQNYSHNNQALAHPKSAGFKEVLSIINYRWMDFWAEYKTVFSVSAFHAETGGNIFTSDSMEYAVKTEIARPPAQLLYMDFKFGYLVNPKTNMNIMTGMIYRVNELPYGYENTRYLYVAFRTALTNLYYDF